LQEATLGPEWKSELPRVKLRIGVHTDTPKLVDGFYCGFAMSRAQRIMDAGHGGQILVSGAARNFMDDARESARDIRCEPLGMVRLRDLRAPVELHRLSLRTLPLNNLPPRALYEGQHNFPEEERPFIGRAQELADVMRLVRERNARLVTITG